MVHLWVTKEFISVLLKLVCISLLISSGRCSICDVHPAKNRIDCYPDAEPSLENCNQRGCCWRDDNGLIGQPFCYFPQNYPSYDVDRWMETSYGYKAYLIKKAVSPWPNDILNLTLDIWFETKTRLHLKIFDSQMKRYEVPIETPKTSKFKYPDVDYNIEYTRSPFGIKVTRKSTGSVLFDTTEMPAPLIYADQFIQVTTSLSTPLLYGLGEHYGPLLINASNYNQFFLWAKDQYPKLDSNLYGAHPFYMNIEPDASSHGVFLLNSNAMDVIVQPSPAVTFRSIGGILDFYIFTGPSVEEVIQQYVQTIGLPTLPPYWGLGFHLCRFKYDSTERLREIINRNRALGLPYEVQWTDIDYMNASKDWTYDEINFKGLPELVEDLHHHGQKYMSIVDPAISSQSAGSYSPYDKGIEKNVFIKNANGEILEGKVWPGKTVFPDFFHPNATQWWFEAASEFHKVLSFDGLWIDMNEPSNFLTGSTKGCSNNNLDNPPYLPGFVRGGKLEWNTICPSAQQYLSSHYNLHNLYGLSEAVVTNRVLKKILNKRTLIVSRSSFPSLGKYAQHWNGDGKSTWLDLYYSIPAILSFQFFGIPFVGVDICGFAGDTTEELCTRWMQLGAFYPFMRNHNDDTSKDQDPGAFSIDTQKIMKNALEARYLFLPFFYTQYFFSSLSGSPVVRPLFFLFPKDHLTYSIDRQFVWGTCLLITPVLEQGATSVSGYFPKGIWFDLFSGSKIDSPGKYYDIHTPLDKINVHLRGGYAIPLQMPNTTTTYARKNPFTVLVALNETKQAEGFLYWDDGETLDVVEKGLYSLLDFQAKRNGFYSNVVKKGYDPTEKLKLGSVYILGVDTKPSTVTVNGQSVNFQYETSSTQLYVTDMNLDLLQEVTMTWS